MRQLWKGRAESSVRLLVKENPGDIPELVKREIGELQKSKVDWKKVLINFIQEKICDYSFSPPDRRYEDTGFYLPAFNEREYVSRDILFMVDTSGSFSDASLSTVYSEIKGAIE